MKIFLLLIFISFFIMCFAGYKTNSDDANSNHYWKSLDQICGSETQAMISIIFCWIFAIASVIDIILIFIRGI